MKVKKDPFEIKDMGENIRLLKDQNYRPYKNVKPKFDDKTTLRREIVKSQQECLIANFLFFNGIEYGYEEPNEIDTRTLDYKQYAPDFSLYQNNRRIYLEHYGINRDEKVPEFFASNGKSYNQACVDYNTGIKWKRELHSSNETICIESYSYEFNENTIYNNLLLNLNKHGFITTLMSDSEKYDVINKNAPEEVNALLDLFYNIFIIVQIQ